MIVFSGRPAGPLGAMGLSQTAHTLTTNNQWSAIGGGPLELFDN